MITYRIDTFAVLKGSGREISWSTPLVSEEEYESDKDNLLNILVLIRRGMSENKDGVVSIGGWMVSFNALAAYKMEAIKFEDEEFVSRDPLTLTVIPS